MYVLYIYVAIWRSACALGEVQTLINVCDIVMMYLWGWGGGEGENSEIEGCKHDGVS
jgi:hypothetical protein